VAFRRASGSHMTHKKSKPESGDQALRPRAGGLVVINLADETAKLRQTIASNDRQAVSLVKDGPLNVLLMTLKKGAELGEHRTRGPLSLHVLTGAIRFHARSQQITLAAGCVLALDRDVAHSVTAIEDSSLLLTTAIA
jgi:quercetin dioxygenase-like cupin family protein